MLDFISKKKEDSKLRLINLIFKLLLQLTVAVVLKVVSGFGLCCFLLLGQCVCCICCCYNESYEKRTQQKSKTEMFFMTFTTFNRKCNGCLVFDLIKSVLISLNLAAV